MTKTKTVKLTAGDRTFYFCINAFLIFIGIVIAIPMWSTITLSFRPNDFIGTNFEGMFLPVWKWDVSAYKALLGNACRTEWIVIKIENAVVGYGS